MPQSVKQNADARYPRSGAQVAKNMIKIALGRLSAATRAKDPVELMLGEVSKQQRAKLNAHWYEAVFISFTVDPENQFFQIHINAPQVQGS